MFLNQESLKIQQGFECLDTVVYQQDIPQGARFSTLAGPLEITFYAPEVVRLRMGNFAKPDYDLLAVAPTEMAVKVTELEGGYQLEAGEIQFSLLNSPMRLSLQKNDRVLLESVTDRAFLGNLRWMPFGRSEDAWLATLALPSGTPVYGLGEKFGPLNRKGQLVASWNEDATTLNAELSYKNTPFAWSPDGWGLFTLTTAKVIHAVGYPQWSHRSYILKVQDTDLDIFLIAGDTPAEIIAKYTRLTGRAPEVPRWSYGAWMSRAYYQTADEVLEVARKLRERQIPCDVLVLDGRAWHKMETRFDFQWDHDRYPDPAGFVGQLKDQNYRLCLWEYPYISTRNPQFNQLAEKNYLLKNAAGQPYVHRWLPYPFDAAYPHLLPSGIVDFTNPEAYQWYRDAHQSLFDIGVSVMKTDYGESIPEDVCAHNGDSGQRLHNVYARLYNQCVYEATEKYSPDGTLVWGRAGWIGSQRFPMQWGGDPQCDWEGLAASVRGGLSWGMSGAPYYSHDIGGFATGEPDPELYIRWTQAGVMTSHARFHGAGRREPWVYGEEAEKIVREWLIWRYRLIPYLQALALEALQTGLPMMRAMPVAFAEDPCAWGFEEQYMLGPALLVVPVIQAGGNTTCYLPPGGWFDLHSGEYLEGPLTVAKIVPLDHIPLFGRAGQILPLGPAVQHTGELKSALELEELWCFGTPQQGLTLPGVAIEVAASGEFTNIPPDLPIKYWTKPNL